MYRKKTFFVSLILLFVSNCTPNNKVSHVYKGVCEDDQAIKIAFDDLLTNAELYYNKEIEVKGFFKWGSEETAIYENKYSSDKRKAFWIEFRGIESLVEDSSGKNLLDTQDEFRKIFDRTILVKGKFDYKATGHLNQYKGSIFAVCSIKVFE